MNESLINLLHKEHEEIMYAIDRITQESAEDSERLKDQWTDVKQQIIPHLVAEEKTLYDTLKGVPQAMSYAQKAHEQHRKLETDIFEINSLPLLDMDGWMTGFNRLKADAQMHFQFEESALFDVEQTFLDQGQQQKIMDEFQKAKDEAKNSTIEGRYEAGFLV